MTESRAATPARFSGPPPPPRHLTVSIADRCNLRCTMCPAEFGEGWPHGLERSDLTP